MEYREFAPPPSSPLVRCLWTLEEVAGDGPVDPVFPDGSPEIIVNLGDPIEAHRPDGVLVVQPDLMLVGQITCPFVVKPTGAVRLAGVRLEPFGGAPFCDDMSGITNHWMDLRELFANRNGRLSADVGATHNPASLESQGATLFEQLLHRAPRRDLPHPAVVAACRIIRERRGNVVLDELADMLGTTSRTLQRRFASEVGIPPKLLARITRFQQVFSAWRHDPRTLASVAADCGYFDQSHLVRDFRDFAGEAPAAALTEPGEFTAFFLP